jgi:predicted nucleic acid-binding protein
VKYYFDTSSLVKIYHLEQGSKKAIELYKANLEICISELATLEFVSAIYRKYREGEIGSDTLDNLFSKFQDDLESRYELLSFSALVFEEAFRLLKMYGKGNFLRTLDSIQLAFYSTYCENSDVFVCSDKRLASIAELEGYTVYLPEGSILKKPGDDSGVDSGVRD